MVFKILFEIVSYSVFVIILIFTLRRFDENIIENLSLLAYSSNYKINKWNILEIGNGFYYDDVKQA